MIAASEKLLRGPHVHGDGHCAEREAARNPPARLRPPSGAPRGAGRRQRLLENAQHFGDGGAEFTRQGTALARARGLCPAPGALEPGTRPQVRVPFKLSQAVKEPGQPALVPHVGVPAVQQPRPQDRADLLRMMRRQMRNPPPANRARTLPGQGDK